MPEEIPITAPQAGTSDNGEDRTSCKRAMQPAFEAITARGAISMGSAAGAEIPEELQALIERAVSSSWTRDDAEAAVRALAREQLGAMGASFD
jgi:hypothetical protein